MENTTTTQIDTEPSDLEALSKAMYQENFEQSCAALRGERNRLLASCDWTQLPDAPLDDAKRQEWLVYRQLLRDITTNEGFPWEITFPTEPT